MVEILFARLKKWNRRESRNLCVKGKRREEMYARTHELLLLNRFDFEVKENYKKKEEKKCIGALFCIVASK